MHPNYTIYPKSRPHGIDMQKLHQFGYVKHQQITFGSPIDLLHLKYKNEICIKHNISMKIISQYKWKLDMTDLNQFKI